LGENEPETKGDAAESNRSNEVAKPASTSTPMDIEVEEDDGVGVGVDEEEEVPEKNDDNKDETTLPVVDEETLTYNGETYNRYSRTDGIFKMPDTPFYGKGIYDEAGQAIYDALIEESPDLVVPFTSAKNLYDEGNSLAIHAKAFDRFVLPDRMCHSYPFWVSVIRKNVFDRTSNTRVEERKAIRNLVFRLSYTPASVLIPIKTYTEAKDNDYQTNEVHHAWAAANGFLGSKWKTDDENTKPASTSACMQMDQVSTPKICEQVVRRLLFQI
jgi:hypothetical protein